MRKHSVVRKLFLATTALIAVIIALIILAQGLFFEHYYRDFKLKELQHSMKQFSQQYDQISNDERETSKLFAHFVNQTNASMSILDPDFNQVSIISPYFIEVQTPSKLVIIRLNSASFMMNDVPQGIHIGEMLTVDGIYMDEQNTILSPVQFQSQHSGLEEGLVRVEGKITDLMIPVQQAFNPYYQDSLVTEAHKHWIVQAERYQTSLQNGISVQWEWTDPWSGVQYGVVILALSEIEQNEGYFFAMTSLQPVGDAVIIFEKYMIYLAPLILLLILILTFVFSRVISRPLLTLNRTAARMAQLDFTIPAAIRSKDEFGELSQSMNTLSCNLDTALRNLTAANTQLQEDMVEKQRQEQLRKELIANISHELKTPLGIVKGFTEGLQDDVAEEKRERYLCLILNEVDRMNALIMDMLELSKFEAKAIRLNIRAISLSRLVEDICIAFTRQLESKQLRIRVDQPFEQLVRADARWIEHVIVNVLSNAIRHAVKQSVIGIHIQDTGSSHVIMRIENEGPSIKEEDLSRIWEQFYRVERARDRKSGGTGLGLAMVKHILELHGSEFGVENTSRGVVFYFSLEIDGSIIKKEGS
ncbi:HAMP domain-containing histidine kinase [Paenibacillus sp. SC116]|uniref:sensor histidine kinase n=1 Tax=Paenibacillus sp. SC116 TaxID=2968986 RepID=UPI00215AB85F|nr:HAMP domain-containing sensor histidine kinase [Paenibacillus sp. SC116]MCR8842212.1 HAMP domain-containing histidine kinase [Paenibacillus sp. SC116]